MLLKIVIVGLLFCIGMNNHKANANLELVSGTFDENYDLIGKNNQRDSVEYFDLKNTPNLMDIIQVMSSKIDSKKQNYEKR